jgi:hypothetical protein
MSFTAKAVLSRWRLLAIGFVVLVIAVVQAWTLTHNQGYMPTQPIAYSHALHAGIGEGQLGIDCLYCHTSAEKSKHAGVPPLDTCMGCHSVVGVNLPEIQKLAQYWDNGESVPWVRIHSMPDHVYFNHAAHVAAGVSCQTCHGAIEEMEIVYQHVDMSMGWCMTCHRSDEYLRTPETQFSYMVDSEEDRESLKEMTGGIWTAADMNAALEGRSPEEMHQIIVEALGYDSLSRQQGRRGVRQDIVEALQNAPLNCNTCHQ